MTNIINIGKACALAGLLVVSACERKSEVVPASVEGVSGASDYLSGGDGWGGGNGTFYALANGVQLDKLSSGYQGGVLGSVTITGLQAGETILGIDFRPANKMMYGVGSTSRIYLINPETGQAQMVGTGPFAPALNSTNVAFDFNPVVDRIRIVTDQDQNLRINPNNGVTAGVDGTINPAGASIAAVAYRNSVAGATSTVLYDIDPSAGKLYRQDPPNAGTLVEIGSMRLNFTGTKGGFDIAPNGYEGMGLFPIDGVTSLFSVDLRSGYSRVVARYSKNYTAIAIPAQGESGSRW